MGAGVVVNLPVEDVRLCFVTRLHIIYVQFVQLYLQFVTFEDIVKELYY